MDTLFIVGQFGIALEVVGAGMGVRYAWETRRAFQAADNPGSYDNAGRDLAMPRDEFIAQFPRQIKVFGLIAVGLILQFVGNFR